MVGWKRTRIVRPDDGVPVFSILQFGIQRFTENVFYSPVSELRIDERLYAVLAEVDDRLQNHGKDNQLDKPWRMDEFCLQPLVIGFPDTVKLEDDKNGSEPQWIFHKEGIGIGEACCLDDICYQSRGGRHVW